MSFETKETIASFGGQLLKLTHNASTTQCAMSLNLFLPPQATTATASPKKVPVLFYLAGLTATGDNGAQKGFFQHSASEKGIAVVYPDTSPRGLNIDGEDSSYDFGTSAGFYVDATKEPWSKGYRMYSYILDELPSALFAQFTQLDRDRVSITGHSMGGHGALTLYLKNPTRYKSVSAFAPVTNPINSPWGKKAFSGYFGDDARDKWREHDATELIRAWEAAEGGPQLDILIDVGTADKFYKEQLLPENFVEAAEQAGVASGVRVRYQADYDHSYYFIASFADDHVEHAARYLFAE